jgi:putative FmdB family regulatory protein
MALYEYECPVCGKLELEHKISEKVEECPKCQEKGIKTLINRLISLSSFQLKGKGWYKTDYGKKSS